MGGRVTATNNASAVSPGFRSLMAQA